jgi:hypothetical protein
MPDVQEVFRMTTQKVRPDPDAAERQIGRQRKRARQRRVGVYALVAALVVGGVAIGITASREGADGQTQPLDEDGPATTVEGLPPTVERLEGIWFEDPGTGVWGQPVMARFGSDGTFSLGGSEAYWLSGMYEVEGRTIRFTATGGACGSRDGFTWEAGIVADGRLESVHLGADADAPGYVGECAIPIGEPYNFTRVSPTSAAAADITPGYYGIPGGDGGPITRATTFSDLDGLWLVEGTGILLRLDWSGSYRLDDGGELPIAPDDSGRVEIRREMLTFVSGGDARECAEGDVMVWTNVRAEDGRLLATVSEDPCARGIGGEVTALFLNVDTP